MKDKGPDRNEKQIRQIIDLKFSTDILFFKHFERSFELPTELNFTHLKALLALNFRGSCTMSELSHKMLLEKGSFTPVAAKLIDKGYLIKERSSDDKRVYNLVLTDTGSKLVTKFMNAHSEYIRSILDHLSVEEQAEYQRLLVDLNEINVKLKIAEGLE